MSGWKHPRTCGCEQCLGDAADEIRDERDTLAARVAELEAEVERLRGARAEAARLRAAGEAVTNAAGKLAGAYVRLCAERDALAGDYSGPLSKDPRLEIFRRQCRETDDARAECERLREALAAITGHIDALWSESEHGTPIDWSKESGEIMELAESALLSKGDK